MSLQRYLSKVALCSLTLLAGMPLWCQSNWKEVLKERLPVYGHRNWIVVADSAYPAQSRPGIETVVADADQLSILKVVLADLAQSKHVRPVVYRDRELSFLTEGEAPGVSVYRTQLDDLLGKAKPGELLHEQIIGKLDNAGQTFRVLIIKSNMTIPYTSVFLQLNCAYWSDEAEKALRAKIH